MSVDINVKGTINNNRFADSGAVGAAAFFDPTKPIYTDSGNYHGYWNWSEVPVPIQSVATFNPLSLLYDRDNQGKTNRSLGNIQLDYKIHGLEDLQHELEPGLRRWQKQRDTTLLHPVLSKAHKTPTLKIWEAAIHGIICVATICWIFI